MGVPPDDQERSEPAAERWLALKTVRRLRPVMIVSTGAAVAFPFFLAGKVYRAKTAYIEVFDRLDSATMTGRLCHPLSDLFLLQWEEQSRLPSGSVVDPCFHFPDAPSRPAVFVTVGTDDHPFNRLIRWIDRWLEAGGRERASCFIQFGTSEAPRGRVAPNELEHPSTWVTRRWLGLLPPRPPWCVMEAPARSWTA